MNFIVAQLLRHLNEEEAFWTLNSLIESILPIDYYINMIGILTDQKVLAHLLQITLPDFVNHMKKMKVDPMLISLQWFMCSFSYNLHSEVSERIWDYFFLYGSKILFCAALALISLIKNEFLKCKSDEKSIIIFINIEDIFFLIKKAPSNFQNVEALIQTMFLKKFKVLTNKRITKLRSKARKVIIKRMKDERPKRTCKKSMYILQLPLNPIRIQIEGKSIDTPQYKCKEDWPICAFDHTLKVKSTMFHQCQSKTGKNWIDNYFDTPPNAKPPLSHYTSSDMLLIERNRHMCSNKPFVNKINKLLILDDNCDDAFPLDLVDLVMEERLNTKAIMKKYIEHILEYEIKEE